MCGFTELRCDGATDLWAYPTTDFKIYGFDRCADLLGYGVAGLLIYELTPDDTTTDLRI